MRKISYRPYLFLILFFFSLMSLPTGGAERIRSAFVCSLAPCWSGLNFLREKTVILVSLPFSAGFRSSDTALELERLQQENHLLKSQIGNVRDWLLNEDRIEEQLARYKMLSQLDSKERVTKEFFQRRSSELSRMLDLQICSLPATVIFREPAFWSSTLWVNVGERDNEKLGMKVIGKNSPVILGTSIVGVVEYVGRAQSRVRLITDSRLAPSVRATRGNEQNRFLLEHLDSLIFALQLRSDLFSSEQESKSAAQVLYRLRQAMQQQSKDLYLAKGELRGTNNPLWRSRSQVLKGAGFNYDFPDAEGPARDLRSGEAYSNRKDLVPLLTEGDLLVTTGLDGIFPEGLRVATVSHVQTLKEGASSYEIEAVSTAGNLDELSHVFILPPCERID